jgi:hypothetical protein
MVLKHSTSKGQKFVKLQFQSTQQQLDGQNRRAYYDNISNELSNGIIELLKWCRSIQKRKVIVVEINLHEPNKQLGG